MNKPLKMQSGSFQSAKNSDSSVTADDRQTLVAQNKSSLAKTESGVKKEKKVIVKLNQINKTFY